MGVRLRSAAPPKGFVAIRVGAEEEGRKRFLVPVVYLNHPLFAGLLKEAEEEYGFEQKGVITIPCHVEHFRHVQGVIARENSSGGADGSSSDQGHHFHLTGCFRA